MHWDQTVNNLVLVDKDHASMGTGSGSILVDITCLFSFLFLKQGYLLGEKSPTKSKEIKSHLFIKLLSTVWRENRNFQHNDRSGPEGHTYQKAPIALKANIWHLSLRFQLKIELTAMYISKRTFHSETILKNAPTPKAFVSMALSCSVLSVLWINTLKRFTPKTWIKRDSPVYVFPLMAPVIGRSVSNLDGNLPSPNPGKHTRKQFNVGKALGIDITATWSPAAGSHLVSKGINHSQCQS